MKMVKLIVLFGILCIVLNSCGTANGSESKVEVEKTTAVGAEKTTVTVAENSIITEEERNKMISDRIKEAPELQTFSDGAANASDTVNCYLNLKASDRMTINAPESGQFFQLHSKIDRSTTEFSEYYREYKLLYQYLYPEHSLDENYLYYCGGDSRWELDDDGNQIEDYKLLKDHYESVMANEQGNVSLMYDETWKPVNEWHSQVALELGNPIGYGYCVINKGEMGRRKGLIYDDLTGEERFVKLDLYTPYSDYQVVGYYSPESEEAFMLQDKEVRIVDAVKFAEKYVDDFPVPSKKERQLEVKVDEVLVYELDDGKYGYCMNTTSVFQGVRLETLRYGEPSSASGIYNTGCGTIFMYRSDDVDIIQNLRFKQGIDRIECVEQIVPFEEAVQVVSEKMTANSKFEIKRVDLVYCEEFVVDEEGYINTETYEENITPCWKFVLYNENDLLSYIYYVNAADSSITRYSMP